MKILLGLVLAVLLANHSYAGSAASDVKVTVSPTIVQAGQTVTVTLTNTSATNTYSTPTSCVFQTVHPSACDADFIYVPSCAGGQALAPGQSKQHTWDLKDNLAQQVPDGGYFFNITVHDSNGFPTKFCPFVQIGFGCSVNPFQYGPGGVGSGGKVPAISSLGGHPQFGNAAFQVVMTNALGGATSMFVVGFAPAEIVVPWGAFMIDPNLPMFSFITPIGGAAGVPGQGMLFIPTPIPNDSQLVGLEVYFQFLVADPVASGGIAHTEGLRIAICQ